MLSNEIISYTKWNLFYTLWMAHFNNSAVYLNILCIVIEKIKNPEQHNKLIVWLICIEFIHSNAELPCQRRKRKHVSVSELKCNFLNMKVF